MTSEDLPFIAKRGMLPPFAKFASSRDHDRALTDTNTLLFLSVKFFYCSGVTMKLYKHLNSKIIYDLESRLGEL